MTTSDLSASDGARESAFMRGAAAVGDLDSKVYQEERSRDVWNEAMAVAFQLATVLALLAVAAMLWIVGRPAMPYVHVVLWVVAIPVFVAIGYARRLGVDAPGFSDLGRVRLAIVGALLVLNLGASSGLTGTPIRCPVCSAGPVR